MFKHRGFTVLSIVLYLSCLTLFALNICTFANHALTFYIKTRASQQDTLEAHSALMLLKRDILQASNSMLNWQTDPVVFKRMRLLSNGTMQERWISWQHEDQGLKRMVGQYDHIKKRWISRKSKLFVCRLEHLKISPVMNNGVVKHITIAYLKGKSKNEGKVSLKNRRVMV